MYGSSIITSRYSRMSVLVFVRDRHPTCGNVGTPIVNCYFLSGNPEYEVTLWQSITAGTTFHLL